MTPAGRDRRRRADPAPARAHAERCAPARRWRPRCGPCCPPSPARCRPPCSPARCPREHGIVGNGWYFRDLGEVLLWRQHNALVQGEKLWDAPRRRPAATPSNVCWWYAMGATGDLLVTPRPDLPRRRPQVADCYTRPPALHDDLEARWARSRCSTTGARTRASPPRRGSSPRRPAHPGPRTARPAAGLRAAPRLRPPAVRPRRPRGVAAAERVDAALAPLLAEDAERRSCSPSTASPRRRQPGRRQPGAAPRGLLEVHTQAGMEYLDPWTSRAFAVADHQVAHVYVRDPADLTAPAPSSPSCPGWTRCSTTRARRSTAWTTSAPANSSRWPSPTPGSPTTTGSPTTARPDFARLVDIHRKPGYDPAELFMDPS